jgi:protein-disulfide isomerase
MSTHLTSPLGPEDHIQGPEDAALQLVEYGDFECPFCGLAHPVVRAVQRRMGARLLFAFRHFPLTQIHPHAEHAAEMAEIAGAEGKFWLMHDMLFANQHALDDASLIGYATRIGIDARRSALALANHTYFPRVRRDFLSGVRSGVNGTPTFFINGVRHDGSWDENSLLGALQSATSAPGARTTAGTPGRDRTL